MRSERYLIDTSIWVEALERRRGDVALQERVRELLAAQVAVTTGVVRVELLSGARDADQFERLSRQLSALLSFDVGEEHWADAAQLAFQLRRRGVTVPVTDILIGAIALREGAILVHRDRHFDLIAANAGLRVESHYPGPDRAP